MDIAPWSYGDGQTRLDHSVNPSYLICVLRIPVLVFFGSHRLAARATFPHCTFIFLSRPQLTFTVTSYHTYSSYHKARASTRIIKFMYQPRPLICHLLAPSNGIPRSSSRVSDSSREGFFIFSSAEQFLQNSRYVSTVNDIRNVRERR